MTLIGHTLLVVLIVAKLAPAMADEAGVGAGGIGQIGLQLYSLQEQFGKDVPGTLDQVKRFGFKYVELYDTCQLPPKEYKALLASRGLIAIGMHFPYDLLRTNAEEVAQEAAALGLTRAGCAWIPHPGGFDEKACREATAVFNHAGEILARHGLRFYYHPHGFEFCPRQQGTLFDLMMSETNPRFVAYEMDVFWVAYAGQDPVKLLEKYGPRWELLHVKDMKKGTPTAFQPVWVAPSTDTSVALGTGQIDLVPFLRAARKAGVEWYIIEDESPLAEKQIPESLRYLEQIRL